MQDILIQVCSKLDNNSLENLSRTLIWNDIRLFAEDGYFWKMRVENLIRRDLEWSNEDWKKTYYILSDALREEDPLSDEVISNELVMKILLDLGYDPSARDNYAIKRASTRGNTEAVKLLLVDKRVDPSTWNNYPIRYASENGHLEIVKLLLADKRVDPSAGDNHAIRKAFSNKHHDIVKLLEAAQLR